MSVLAYYSILNYPSTFSKHQGIIFYCILKIQTFEVFSIVLKTYAN